MKLYELAFACHIYNQMTNYDQSYLDLIRAAGGKVNLDLPGHRIALLEWLNKWGCRQFAKEYHDLASEQIARWYRKSQSSLPEPGKPLQELSDAELSSACHAYGDLVQRLACRRSKGEQDIAVTVGPTGAAKILFALRPEALVPWDEAIRQHMNLDGSLPSYRTYLTVIRAHIDELAEACAWGGHTLADLPGLVGRPGFTLVKLIDEYHWVTISQRCHPPTTETIAQWAIWEWQRKKAQRVQKETPHQPEPEKPSLNSKTAPEFRPSGKTIVLVACVKEKDSKPRPAQELYVSSLFQKASAYARRLGDEWYILSARYGLIEPEEVIAPYDQTLKTMTRPAQQEWAQKVLGSLRSVLNRGDRVVILAGQAYRANLIEPIRQMGCTIEVPMEGLMFGQQLQWLTRQLEKPAP